MTKFLLPSVLLALLAVPSCSNDAGGPSGAGPVLAGKWAGSTVGVVATRTGLQLWLQCGDSGIFDGPIQLDSLNQFAASGSLHLSTGTLPGLIVGRLSQDVLAVQWGLPQRPPSLDQALYYLLPDDTGRPTDPVTQCAAR